MDHFAFNCGGNYANGANAGVFYANGNNGRTNANGNIGFRSALPHMSDIAGSRACFQY